MADIPNTLPQEQAHAENEKQAALEATWPLFQVELSGDEAEWVARPNPLYWFENGEGTWVPREDLPEGVTVNNNGNIVMTARAIVTCRAKNEDMAKMRAMSHNPDYHTVEEVKQISE